MTGEIAAKVSVARLASVRFLFLLGLGLLSSIRIASAQVELKAYANADGYIDCSEVDLRTACKHFSRRRRLGIWYGGWYNGLAKKHAVIVPRVKEGIHNVIVYCKANRDKRIIQAIDVILKQDRARQAGYTPNFRVSSSSRRTELALTRGELVAR